MKILIAEDDFASRKFMLRFLSEYGECDVTVDGKEAVEAFTMAIEDKEPYDLVCLDIMMPEMDGYGALQKIREIEQKNGINQKNASKIIMTTALNDGRNVMKAFSLGCVAYAGKPIDPKKLEQEMIKLGLIKKELE